MPWSRSLPNSPPAAAPRAAPSERLGDEEAGEGAEPRPARSAPWAGVDVTRLLDAHAAADAGHDRRVLELQLAAADHPHRREQRLLGAQRPVEDERPQVGVASPRARSLPRSHRARAAPRRCSVVSRRLATGGGGGRWAAGSDGRSASASGRGPPRVRQPRSRHRPTVAGAGPSDQPDRAAVAVTRAPAVDGRLDTSSAIVDADDGASRATRWRSGSGRPSGPRRARPAGRRGRRPGAVTGRRAGRARGRRGTRPRCRGRPDGRLGRPRSRRDERRRRGAHGVSGSGRGRRPADRRSGSRTGRAASASSDASRRLRPATSATSASDGEDDESSRRVPRRWTSGRGQVAGCSGPRRTDGWRLRGRGRVGYRPGRGTRRPRTVRRDRPRGRSPSRRGQPPGPTGPVDAPVAHRSGQSLGAHRSGQSPRGPPVVSPPGAHRSGQSPRGPPVRRAETKASCGTSTDPTFFIFFLPSFCFSSSLRLRDTSPP